VLPHDNVQQTALHCVDGWMDEQQVLQLEEMALPLVDVRHYAAHI
jgi:hypothetical protein